MTKRPLIVLGVVTAFGLAATQPEARQVCASTPVDVTRANHQLTCIDEDRDTVFSAFNLFLPGNVPVTFPSDDSISIGNARATSPIPIGGIGDVFGYTVTNDTGLTGVSFAAHSSSGAGVLTTRYLGGGLILSLVRGAPPNTTATSGIFVNALRTVIVVGLLMAGGRATLAFAFLVVSWRRRWLKLGSMSQI